MNVNDQPGLAEILKEVCEIYSKPYSEVLLHAYYRVLKAQSFEAISKAILRLLSDESRRQVMPTAAEIKAIARHMESAAGHQNYLPCQRLGCEALVAFPPQGEMTEASYFCPRHKPTIQKDWPEEKQIANAANDAEIHTLFQTAPPGAKAFLRSAVKSIFAKLLADIPITEEERQAQERMDVPRRALAFEGKAEGPGVNPSVFLNHPYLALDLPDDYVERRQIVAGAGWKYDPSAGSWTKGRRHLSDEQIDSFSDRGLLAEFVRREKVRV